MGPVHHAMLVGGVPSHPLTWNLTGGGPGRLFSFKRPPFGGFHVSGQEGCFLFDGRQGGTAASFQSLHSPGHLHHCDQRLWPRSRLAGGREHLGPGLAFLNAMEPWW